MIEKMNYKKLCESPFEMDSSYGVNFKMLVYTEERKKERPVFKVVYATDCCKMRIGRTAKVFWGIVGFDPKSGESEWYNYNNCVSLENWAVLDRLLKKRFGWMETEVSHWVEEIKLLAKKQLEEYKE